MDGQVVLGHDWALLVDGLSNHVHDSSESGWANWHGNRASSVVDLLSSDQTLGRVQSDSSHVVASQMLSDFQNQFILDPLHFECVENWWQIAFELNINHSTNDLRNLPNGQCGVAEASYKISVRILSLNLCRQEARLRSAPRLLSHSDRGRSVWVSGCATGYLLFAISLDNIFEIILINKTT